jgi:beta-glucosidase
MNTWARDEWDFKGYIVSDQGAAYGVQYDHNYTSTSTGTAAAVVSAGLDLEDADSPTKLAMAGLKDAVAADVSVGSMVNQSNFRLFYIRLRLGEFDPPETNPFRQIPTSIINSMEHLQLSQASARSSFVLLKNAKATLPVHKSALVGKVAVIGPFGNCPACMYGKYAPREDETSDITVTPLAGINRSLASVPRGRYASPRRYARWSAAKRAEGPNGEGMEGPNGEGMEGADVSDALVGSGEVAFAAGCSSNRCKDYNATGKEAVQSAVAGSSLVIVCLGNGASVESEDRDRTSLALPGSQPDILRDASEAAKQAGAKLVLLLFSAGPVDLSWAAPSDDVHAIIVCFYPGQRAGAAIADVIFATEAAASSTASEAQLLTGASIPSAPTSTTVYSPAGRLPFTWPTLLSDVQPLENYTMDGRTYRYDQHNVLFPFGFGLSYSSFQYSSLSVISPSKPAKPCDEVTVTVTVTNTGDVDAEEVVQVYIAWEHSPLAPAPAPNQQLVAFRRLSVASKESITILLVVPPRQLAFLTNPRCGKIANNMRYQGAAIGPDRNGGTAGACCQQCAAMEECQAFTFDGSSQTCTLLAHRTRAGIAAAGFVSGDTLPVWVQHTATATVAVGGQQPPLADGSGARLASNVLSTELQISGDETPISTCK